MPLPLLLGIFAKKKALVAAFGIGVLSGAALIAYLEKEKHYVDNSRNLRYVPYNGTDYYYDGNKGQYFYFDSNGYRNYNI